MSDGSFHDTSIPNKRKGRPLKNCLQRQLSRDTIPSPLRHESPVHYDDLDLSCLPPPIKSPTTAFADDEIAQILNMLKSDESTPQTQSPIYSFNILDGDETCVEPCPTCRNPGI
ncbi:Uncharacterized protein QTN25_006963 [Entamoeba marina]